jgi:hypothetical protein
VVDTITELQRVQQFGGTFVTLGSGHSGIDRRNLDIFLRG